MTVSNGYFGLEGDDTGAEYDGLSRSARDSKNDRFLRINGKQTLQ